MQKIYLLDIDNIAQNTHKILPFLDKNSVLKAESFANKEDKLRSLGSSLLINAFTARSELKFNEYGKPYKAGKPYFNVSHSGEKVGICICDNAEVGFDIQKIKPIDEQLVNYAFSAEKTFIKTDRDFAKFWTMKESAVKCLGNSVINLKNHSISDLTDSTFNIFGKMLYYQSEFLEDYALTVCSFKPCDAQILQIDCEFILKTLAKKS